jgi:curved DNA-binding protein
MPAYGYGADRSPQRGQDVEGDILVMLDEVLHGSTRDVQLQRTDPRTGQSTTQTLRVKIPAGVREGQLVRLVGKGRDGVAGGEPGNLYLRVKLGTHPDLRVEGSTLHYDLELAPWEAVLGTTVKIPTLDGSASLKIPAGTTAGRVFRLRGQGLPTEHAGRGDLHAVVGIQVPSTLSAEQKSLWEKLAAGSADFHPRQAPWEHRHE